jgi:AcrR family transcriptional regulator
MGNSSASARSDVAVDRRTQILDAGAEAFAARRYEGASVAEIGDRVGISASALYRYFGSKESLLSAVVLTTISGLQEVVAKYETADEPESLRRCLRSLVSVALGKPTYHLAYLRERHRVTGDDIVALKDAEQEFVRAIADFARRVNAGLGRDEQRSDEELAACVFAAIGAMTAYTGQYQVQPMARPQLDHLIVDAVVPMLLGPSVPPTAEVTVSSSGWRATPTRRQAIMEAAIPLFFERGFNGVGVAEIGEASGIGGPNIYRYYDAKDDILVDMADTAAARCLTAQDLALDDCPDAHTAMSRAVGAFVETSFRDATLVAVVTQEAASLPLADLPRIRRRTERIENVWQVLVAECRPELTASEVAALVGASFSIVTFFAQQHLVALPDPAWTAAFIERFLLGEQSYASASGSHQVVSASS